MIVSANRVRSYLGRLSWWLSLVMLTLIAGCRRVEGPEISISWRVPKPGLEKGVPLRYESIQIGQVTSVAAAPDGVTVRVMLHRKYAHYVRTKMTFLFQSASAGSGAFIEGRALDKDAPPAPPGAHFEGEDSYLKARIKEMTTDWKRTALFCGIGLLFVLALVLILKLLFKLWGVVLCTAGGAAVATALSPLVGEHLKPLLPEGTRVDLLAYLVAFLVGSLVTSLVLGIVLRTFRAHA